MQLTKSLSLGFRVGPFPYIQARFAPSMNATTGQYKKSRWVSVSHSAFEPLKMFFKNSVNCCQTLYLLKYRYRKFKILLFANSTFWNSSVTSANVNRKKYSQPCFKHDGIYKYYYLLQKHYMFPTYVYLLQNSEMFENQRKDLQQFKVIH